MYIIQSNISKAFFTGTCFQFDIDKAVKTNTVTELVNLLLSRYIEQEIHLIPNEIDIKEVDKSFSHEVV